MSKKRQKADDAAWLAQVESLSKTFAAKHSVLLASNERQISASFEVGCFHAVIRFYEDQAYSVKPMGLVEGVFRYLTTPSGNPENFSYVRLSGSDGDFELRQQVRVQSHIDPDICFTPDLVVLFSKAKLLGERREDFAGGKRPFFKVASEDVVAAHECKSTNPFPELLVSFIGMLVAAHKWYEGSDHVKVVSTSGHLAPTLFVGGTARTLHLKMIAAMQRNYGMNIVCGLHSGTMGLKGATSRLEIHRSGLGGESSAGINPDDSGYGAW